MGLSRAELDHLSINTIRTLSMDAVQEADSGHPGTPMALAPVAYCLWQRHLRYDPRHPLWPDRDRFVLSAGHASMLLYSLIHLAGVRDVGPDGRPLDGHAISLDDIRSFRQLGSKCAGHPEYGLAAGIETTTGPLGQGVATSVGMAVAGRWMAARYNRPGDELFVHDVYALASDGDLMEGVSFEAASLAGHLGLANLCWIYDSNSITIDGGTDLAFTEDIAARFAAQRWSVRVVTDANDLDALDAAFAEFRSSKQDGSRQGPMLIIVSSHIAFGAPNKQDTSAAHGAPLGEEEVRLAKRSYGWDENARFAVPDGVREHFDSGIGKRGGRLRQEWEQSRARYADRHPDSSEELERLLAGKLPPGWSDVLPTARDYPEPAAGRAVSGKVLNALAERVPWLIGGSADLASSNKTELTFEGAEDLTARSPGGRRIRFGVREHAMAALANGLALSGLRPFVSTFLVFSDYARPAIRLAALMELPSILVFTHDSISLGEDGPTHQPVEHLASLRAMPGLIVFRPADAAEVIASWRFIMELTDAPAALVLSRQALPSFDREIYGGALVERGGYVLADCATDPSVLLIATGSEVRLCVEAHERLRAEGIATRVVSMPSLELFERQTREYRDGVLPPGVTARVVVEQGAGLGWARYAGPTGRILSIDTFGASAPMEDVQRHFGFTVDAVVEAARSQVS